MLDLIQLHEMLATAQAPEHIFGQLKGTPALMLAGIKQTYRTFVLIAHPDRSPHESLLAAETFRLLNDWRRRAEQRIRAGIYGRPSRPPVHITTRRGTYQVHEPPTAGDYFISYACTSVPPTPVRQCTLKIVRDARDNDLLVHESQLLRTLNRGNAVSRRYFPELVDTFLSTDGAETRQSLIIARPHRTITLAAVRAAHPAGLDPRDAAWMFNRVLETLWFTHQHGLIHAAVLPSTVTIAIDTHGLILTEWAFATAVGAPFRAISNDFRDWFSPEVLAKSVATPATDIFMAARCFLYLVGGNPLADIPPATLPPMLQRFIRGCLLHSPARRPHDVGALRDEFNDCLNHLYGKPAFRPLAMPI